MRIIGCGDIHMSPSYLERIPDAQTADLIVINGDMTNYGSTQEAKSVLDEVMRINPNVLAQVGNLDKFEINSYLEELSLNLHAQARIIDGKVCLVGLGGSNPTPFGTPTEFSENTLEEIGTKAFEQANEFLQLAEPLNNKKIPVIFVSHPPPHGTAADRLNNGQHVGSKAVRKLIEKYQPELCLTGHIHEAVSADHIANTPVINPGMLSKGGWVEITIDTNGLLAKLQGK